MKIESAFVNKIKVKPIEEIKTKTGRHFYIRQINILGSEIVTVLMSASIPEKLEVVFEQVSSDKK